MKARAALLASAILWSMPAAAVETVLDLPTRGSSMRVLVDSPANPVGAVILIAGGSGRLDIEPDGRIAMLSGNQLVRTRSQYTAQGLATAVPDIAEDLKVGKSGVRDRYRWSAEQAADLGALIDHLRRTAAKVYLVGTSRGALSTANAAVRLQGTQRPNAIVITSGMLMHKTADQPSVERNVSPLTAITMPTLLLANEDDACAYTPASATMPFKALLTASPRVDVAMLRGGNPDRKGMECEAAGYHGFSGLDAQVVRTIADWLKALN